MSCYCYLHKIRELPSIVKRYMNASGVVTILVTAERLLFMSSVCEKSLDWKTA